MKSHFAACALIALGYAAATDVALAFTPQQEQAMCQGDAMRLCNAAIPDRARVAACLKANRAQLSPDCKKVFPGSSHRRGR